MTQTAQQAYTAYKRAQVMTASPEQLVLMLYDAAKLHVKHARLALAGGDNEATFSHLEKSQAIVAELVGSLDMNIKDISPDLFRIYGFINSQLVKAMLHRDQVALETVTEILATLRDAWAEAVGKGHRTVEGVTVAI